MTIKIAAVPLISALALVACSDRQHAVDNRADVETTGAHEQSGVVALTAQQVSAAGIEVVGATVGAVNAAD